MKPPFSDAMCGGDGGKASSEGGQESKMFSMFARQMRNDVNNAEDDPMGLLSDWGDCMADNYVSDGCEHCGDMTMEQELPIDKAFFAVFENMRVIQDTVEMKCVDRYTLSYSVDTWGKLKGVYTPITWNAQLHVTFNDDGDVMKITDLTPFHRNLNEIFYGLLTDHGDKSAAGCYQENEDEDEDDRGDVAAAGCHHETEEGDHGDVAAAGCHQEKEDADEDEDEETIPIVHMPMTAPESAPQMNTISMVTMALIVLIAVVIGVFTGVWIALNCQSKPKPVSVGVYGKVLPEF